jgi:nitric oxide reductase NorE protein
MTVTQSGVSARAGRPAAVPGEPGLWVFLFADMLLFAALFGVILYIRDDQPELFRSSQATLSQTIGLLNTVLLLTGSLLVATAVRDARLGKGRPDRSLLGAIGCGSAFLGLKAIEWGSSIAAGHTASSNDFYSAYYMLTGLHLVHVVLGVGVLVIVRRASRTSRMRVDVLEGAGCYWHLVDLLWVVLFPLIYLMPAG